MTVSSKPKTFFVFEEPTKTGLEINYITAHCSVLARIKFFLRRIVVSLVTRRTNIFISH